MSWSTGAGAPEVSKEPRQALPWPCLEPCIPSQGDEALDGAAKHGPYMEWLGGQGTPTTPARLNWSFSTQIPPPGPSKSPGMQETAPYFRTGAQESWSPV